MQHYLSIYAGCLDGEKLIEMNNLSLGYFPPQITDPGLYPAPMPVQVVPVLVPMPVPADLPLDRRP